MNNSSRTDTINSLAKAMGIKTVSNYDRSKYNTSTGTIYCNGVPVTVDTISSTIAFFESMREKSTKILNPNAKTVTSYYDIAITALKDLQQKTAEANAPTA